MDENNKQVYKGKEEPHSLGDVPPLLRALTRHPGTQSSAHPLLIS